MNEVHITVDVYCNWEADSQAYRVYIDDDLLTERTYYWRNNEYFVQEIIVANLDAGIHTFRLVPVNQNFTGFSYRNFTINHQPNPTDKGQFIVN